MIIISTLKKTLLCLVVLFSCMAVNAYAATPEILFSDMTDGPTTGWEQGSTKGAAVSIWCRNIGSSRGTNYVTVGGVNLTSSSDYAEWGATTNPTVPLGMQRITFYLNSSMSTTGTCPNTTISITTSEGTSSTIPFHCRSLGNNHIYFLDNVNGSDSNSGLTVEDAKRTTAWARGNLKAGDVCYLKGSGTPYTDHDIGTGYHFGGLFSFGRVSGAPNHENGIEGKSITVTAYPCEDVQMKANTENSGIALTTCVKMFYSGSQLSYWTFSKFTMEAAWATFSLGGGGYVGGISNLRIIGNDCTTILTSTSQWGNIICLYGSANGMDHLYMYGNYLHDQCANFRGQDTGRRVYQVYIGGYGALDYILVGWNDMGWGSQGRGFQVYGHTVADTLDNFYVHDNYFHNNTRQCVILGGGDGGAAYGFMKNCYFYNNIVAYPGGGDSAILIGGGGNGRHGGNFFIYNNTFYSPDSTNPILNITDGMDHFDFKNNIIYGRETPWDYLTYHPSTSLGSPTGTRDHNIYYGNGEGAKPSWDSSTLDNDNPLFSFSSPDEFSEFSIQSGSPCVNSGTSTVSAVVKTDIIGIPRPQGAGHDIGAYEYNEGTEPPPPVDDTTPPTGSIGINSGAAETENAVVTLQLSASDTESSVSQMQFSNNNADWSSPETYATSKSWTLSAGLGTKTVYVKYKDGAGNWSSVYNDTIELVDNAAPGDVTAVSYSVESESLTVSWTNPGDADFVGTMVRYGASAYPADHTQGVLFCNQETAPGASDSYTGSLPEGTYYFSFFTYDQNGNYYQTTHLTVVVSYAGGETYTKVFGDSSGADYQGIIQDTFINLNTDVNVSSDALNTYTWPVDQVANAIIMKIDLAAIPAGAQIQSAELRLYMNGFSETGGDDLYDVSVHKIINHNPQLGGCTGYTYDGSHEWTANDSCYNNIPMAQSDIAAAEDSKSINKTYGYKSWDITNMVRDWVQNPASNYGLLLNSDSTAGSSSNRIFASSEASDPNQRPELVITYATGGSVPDTTPPAAPTGLGVH